MRKFFVVLSMIGMLAMSQSTWAAQGAISKEYHGMWGAGECGNAKFYMHIKDNGMQMFAGDKRMPLGNWVVKNVRVSGKGIIIDTNETHSQQPTHMELTKLPNGHLTLLLKIGGNSGIDELVGC